MDSKVEIASEYPEKRRVGRPVATEEMKAARAAKKREYMKKYRLEHPETFAASKQRSITRALMDKKWYCPQCDQSFQSHCMLKYHLQISRAHIDEQSERQFNRAAAGPATIAAQ